MVFYNINDPSEIVSLRQAVLKSLSQTSGLYMPELIPSLHSSFFSELKYYGLKEIAYEVSKKMLGDEVPHEVLGTIVKDAFTYPVPLRQLDNNLFVLELFHGPTLAFKDIGARYMAGLFSWLVKDEKKEITILAATSGDTGSAVANAFFGREGIKVVILYPSGKVSRIQEKQLTTLGGNITAIEVYGDFDDCQTLVKMAFTDKELNSMLNLTSANSINFARLFPQSFFYFYAMAQLPENIKPVAISVPSGNFGNLTAGLIARKMGLPVDTFIASCNANHSVVDYLEKGNYQAGTTVQTISNAMDVGNPSNFPRILALFDRKFPEITSCLKGYWYNDTETRTALAELFEKYDYQADPHGAVAFLGLKEYMNDRECKGIFLETAHPAKFPDEVEKATNSNVEIPDSLKQIMGLEKKAMRINADFPEFRDFLVQTLS